MQSPSGCRDDQRVPSYGLNDVYSRTYPAIEAVLQRKAAIVALQQGLNRHTLLEHSELHLVHDQGHLGGCGSDCQVQVASQPQIHDSMAQPISSSDVGHFRNSSGSADALPGPTLTGTADGSSYSREREQQQPAQLSAAADVAAAPVAISHSSIAGKRTDVNLFAEELARLRRRHQQRTVAAVTIQAAVRKWLAWKHTKQRLILLTGGQDQHAGRPHIALQFDPAGCLGTGERADSPATVHGVPQSVAAGGKCVLVGYKEPGISDSATSSTNNRPGGTCTAKVLDSWEWQRCRKAVGLRCKQVLRSHGAYGMAAEYHRLRVQGAVMFGWGSCAGCD